MTAATARDQLEAILWRTLPGITADHVDALLKAADDYAEHYASDLLAGRVNYGTGRRRLEEAASECLRVVSLAPHGTRAAYVRHKRGGEEPCEPCAEALRAYTRNRARTRRAGKAAAA